jgi:AraC-like DNA-binding protein
MLEIYEDAELLVANFFRVSAQHNSWGPRILKECELIYLVEGQGEFISEKKKLQHQRDQVLVIPPREKHTYRVLQGVISCIHFRLPRGNYPRACQYIDTTPDREILRLFRSCAVEWEGARPRKQELCSALIRVILIRLERLQSTSEKAEFPLPLRRALAWYDANFREQTGRSQAAAHANISPQYLSALFRTYLGTTPSAWLTGLRLAEAKRILVRERVTVREAALRTGFTDPLYFSRLFRRHTGLSPAGYRQMV